MTRTGQRVLAVWPAFQLQDWQLANGSFFTSWNDASASNSAVLSQTVPNSLFSNGQKPIGQLIRIWRAKAPKQDRIRTT